MCLDDEARKQNTETIWREVSGAHPFRLGDVKDPYGLVFGFWDPASALADKLRKKFGWQTRQQMHEYDGTPPPPERLVLDVLGELNQLIEGPCLYDERLFSEVDLTGEALTLIGGGLEWVEKMRLNRVLLELVCWPSLARSAGFAQNLKTLEGWAVILLTDKEIHGELNGEAHFTPMDVALDAIVRLADGKPLWDRQKSKLMTFARLVMRSFVSHELDKSENKTTERLGWPDHQSSDGAFVRDDEVNRPDPDRERIAQENAEYKNIMTMFHEDSLEYKVLEVIYYGKGNERPHEIANLLGVSVSEVSKAKKNILEMLIHMKYFKRDDR